MRWRTYEQAEADFWARVNKTDSCWEWTGVISRSGYGQVRFAFISNSRIPQSTHRIAWQLVNGPIPDGMDLCHTCDNRRCVRPDHLFLGTDLDNARDRDAKGRTARLAGARNARAKLTEQDVRSIRGSDSATKALARRFSVSPRLIRKIRARELWRHVDA